MEHSRNGEKMEMMSGEYYVTVRIQYTSKASHIPFSRVIDFPPPLDRKN